MKKEMLKTILFGLSIQIANGSAVSAIDATDRDPTAPNPRILERLGATQRVGSSTSVSDTKPREAPQVAVKTPEIRLKAIVFSDENNASAILSANGRSILLNLSRERLGSRGNNPTKSSIGFSLEGVSYSVEDFSDHSIVVRVGTDNSVIVIQ